MIVDKLISSKSFQMSVSRNISKSLDDRFEAPSPKRALFIRNGEKMGQQLMCIKGLDRQKEPHTPAHSFGTFVLDQSCFQSFLDRPLGR